MHTQAHKILRIQSKNKAFIGPRLTVQQFQCMNPLQKFPGHILAVQDGHEPLDLGRLSQKMARWVFNYGVHRFMVSFGLFNHDWGLREVTRWTFSYSSAIPSISFNFIDSDICCLELLATCTLHLVSGCQNRWLFLL